MTNEYRPRPPRPPADRGSSGPNAAYKRSWYLENRERILKKLREKKARSKQKLERESRGTRSEQAKKVIR